VFSVSGPNGTVKSPAFTVAASGITHVASQTAATAQMVAGVMPYLYFDVYYDATNGQIGLRPKS
jgi:hypothetical protein